MRPPDGDERDGHKVQAKQFSLQNYGMRQKANKPSGCTILDYDITQHAAFFFFLHRDEVQAECTALVLCEGK